MTLLHLAEVNSYGTAGRTYAFFFLERAGEAICLDHGINKRQQNMVIGWALSFPPRPCLDTKSFERKIL